MPNEQKPEPIIYANKKINPISRHHARRYALQAMYQWQLSGNPIEAIESEFLHFHGIDADKKMDLAYFRELVQGIPKNKHELDQLIQPFVSRPYSEIDPIELAVLRIATYELKHRIDVPYRVIINEALELTKQFGSVEGFKFVNGVLDRVAKSLRQNEK